MHNIAIFNLFCSKASSTRFCCPFYRTFNVWRTLTISPRCNHFMQPIPVCCWFSPLLREVFLRVLRFSPLLKNQHFQFLFDQKSGRRRTTMWMCYLQIVIYLFYYLLTLIKGHLPHLIALPLLPSRDSKIATLQFKWQPWRQFIIGDKEFLSLSRRDMYICKIICNIQRHKYIIIMVVLKKTQHNHWTFNAQCAKCTQNQFTLYMILDWAKAWRFYFLGKTSLYWFNDYFSFLWTVYKFLIS